MNAYDRFARVYDRVGQSTPAEIMKNGYLQQLLDHCGWQGSTILDLGCGTGTLAIWLAEQGYTVTALDASAAMVEQARRKAEWQGQHTNLSWLVQDIRSLELEQRFDLVIALNAVLSHILDADELAEALGRIGQVMQPGSLFLFELPTRHAMQNVWGNNRVVEVHDDITWIWQHRWDNERASSFTELTHFVPAQEHPLLYERIFEVHVHRAYSREEIEPLLSAAKLQLREIVGFGTLDRANPYDTEVIYIVERA